MRHPGIAVLVTMVLGLGSSVRLLQPASPYVRTLRVGTAPVAMALAPAMHRALVLDGVGGRVHILDTSTGTALQTVTLGGAASVGVFPLAAAIDARNEHAFVYTQDGSIYTIDLARGLVLRRTIVPSAPTSLNLATLAVDAAHDRLFARNYYADTLSMLDARTARIVRAISIEPAATVTIDERCAVVIVAAAGSATRMLDERSGQDVAADRSSPCARGTPIGVPTYTVDSPSGVWTLLHGRSGAVLCIAPLGGAAGLVAVDAHLHRLFSLDPGHDAVHMVNEQRGMPSWTARVAAEPVALAVDGRRHHLLVASTGPTDLLGRPLEFGTLSVIDEQSGRVLRTLPVGAAPNALAVDEQSGLAFVLNSNTNPDGSAARVRGQPMTLLEGLRRLLPWLPLPARAGPPRSGSVTVLDLGRL